MYLDKGSLLPVVSELSKREWRNKSRVIQTGRRKGQALGGKPFDKCSLYQLLTNTLYVGKIAHKGAIYDGEHDAIIAAELFDRVQALLKTNGRTGGAEVRNKYGALLRGLLRCKSCGHSMTHTFAGGRNSRAYRYYRCIKAIKSGAACCPTGTLPAAEIERVVVDEIRTLATDRALLNRVLAEAQASIAAERDSVMKEREGLKRQLKRDYRELRKLAIGSSTSDSASQIAHLHERIADAERQLAVIDTRAAELDADTITREEAAASGPSWPRLATRTGSRPKPPAAGLPQRTPTRAASPACPASPA